MPVSLANVVYGITKCLDVEVIGILGTLWTTEKHQVGQNKAEELMAMGLGGGIDTGHGVFSKGGQIEHELGNCLSQEVKTPLARPGVRHLSKVCFSAECASVPPPFANSLSVPSPGCHSSASIPVHLFVY
jgi:hypothetical protein